MYNQSSCADMSQKFERERSRGARIHAAMMIITASDPLSKVKEGQPQRQTEITLHQHKK